MPAPRETYKLARGVGRLIRTSPRSPWTWQRWDQRQKKWVTTPTNERNRSRAEQFAYQQVALRNGSPVHAAEVRVLFSTVASDYITARQEGRDCKRLRKSSMLKLVGAIRAFKLFAGRGYETLGVDQVDAAMLRGFAEQESSRIKPESANLKFNFILSVLQYAHGRTLIAEVPKVNGVHVPTPDDGNENGVTGSAVPTAEEVRLIIKHTKVKKVATGRTKGDGRPIYDGINANDYTDLFMALCLTGMRIGEAVHLTWDDVDFENKVILIRAGMKNGEFWQPKTKHGNRRIALVPELATILNRCRQANRKNKWVFETRRGTKLRATTVQDRFRHICGDLGFEKRFTPHSLRKYWASTVAQQGMPWQVMIKMFGHGDFKLIMETYYAQNDDARLVKEAGKIDFGLADTASDDGGSEGASNE